MVINHKYMPFLLKFLFWPKPCEFQISEITLLLFCLKPKSINLSDLTMNHRNKGIIFSLTLKGKK